MSQQTSSPKRRSESSWGRRPTRTPDLHMHAHLHAYTWGLGREVTKWGNICSVIVLLAKKTERPEDSKNRQISAKTKNLSDPLLFHRE